MIMLHFISINTVNVKMIFRQNNTVFFENYNLTPLDNYVQWTISCLFYQTRRKNPLVYKGLSLSKTTFRDRQIMFMVIRKHDPIKCTMNYLRTFSSKLMEDSITVGFLHLNSDYCWCTSLILYLLKTLRL